MAGLFYPDRAGAVELPGNVIGTTFLGIHVEGETETCLKRTFVTASLYDNSHFRPSVHNVLLYCWSKTRTSISCVRPLISASS